MPASVFFTSDAALALKRAGSFLRARPVHNNLLLTLFAARAARPEPGRYWIVRESSRATGVMFQSPLDFPAAVSRLGKTAVSALVNDAHARGIAFPGVNGDAASTTTFAAEWAERTKSTVEPYRAMRLYEARRSLLPPHVRGQFRLADNADADTVLDWAKRFAEELRDLAHEGPKTVLQRIAEGRMYVWDDGGPVAMASTSPACVNVYRVQLVYTPSVLRGRGYAGALVATLTKRLLDDAGRVVLYADLANPTANAIYRRIGYRPLAETLTFRFGA